MPEAKRFATASIHGHVCENGDDGLDTTANVVLTAARLGLAYIGTSSHRTTANMSQLFRTVNQLNDSNGAAIIPVPGVELNVHTDGPNAKLGHLLIAQVGMCEDPFISWLERIIAEGPPELAETIKKAIGDFPSVIAVITHPGISHNRLPSVPFTAIQKLAGQLNPSEKTRVCIETRNGFTHVLTWLGENGHRENQAEVVARDCGFGLFAGSDFHHPRQIPSVLTGFEIHQGQPLTPQTLLTAVEQRETRAVDYTSPATKAYNYWVAARILVGERGMRKNGR